MTQNKKYYRMIRTMAKRFESYGYEKMMTPAFESYDLYTRLDRSLQLNEMMKVIDYTGEVLVLRPDVTIPLMKRQLREKETKQRLSNTRFYYVQEVFRQPFTKDDSIERPQMGVECFEPSTPERDAEMIALASHALHDLHIDEHTVEVGYASFLNDLLAPHDLSREVVEKIEQYVQAKNSAELDTYLSTLQVPQSLREVLVQIPTLYGSLHQIEERLEQYTAEQAVKETLEKMKSLSTYLNVYGLEEQVVFDFGLVNKMDYYSDLLFQAYVDGSGRPVLMGGRYDALSERLGGELEAIGFAFDLLTLSEVIPTAKEDEVKKDVIIRYGTKEVREAIRLATELRNRSYRTVIERLTEKQYVNAQVIVELTDQIVVQRQENRKTYETLDEVLDAFIRK